MRRITILFDAENHQEELAALKSWKLPYHFSFRGYHIKAEDENNLPIDITQTDLFVILIGASTNYLSVGFFEDVREIINSDKAILCFNLGKTIGLDENNCPRLLWNCGTINMPFTKDDFTYTLDIIVLDARIIDPKKSYHIRKNPRPYHSE
jgi:hypothetical protein